MIQDFWRTTTTACLAVVLGACVTIAAAGAVLPPGTRLAEVQELRRNNGAEPESLDPALVESTPASRIVGDLFEGLSAIDNHGKTVAGAAESWQQQPDLTTWVFKLRPNATWSDGSPVTANDFVYAWRRLVQPVTAAPMAETYGGYLLNGAAIAKSHMSVSELGVRALDPSTLEVKTPYPIPFLPQLLAAPQFSPVPRVIVEKYGAEWMKPGKLVGNGAYMLKDWVVNGKIVVDKNPRYWDAGNVLLTRVTYLAVEDGNADLRLYQSGENDMMLQVPAGTYESLKTQYRREMHVSRLDGMRFYALNNQDPLLKDVRLRKALSMVIDRDVLAQKITADGQAPVYGLAITSTEGVDPLTYEWAAWPMHRRVAEARSLLASAGVRPGTRLSLAYNAGDYHKKMAVFMSSEWKSKLELDTRMESVENKVLNRKLDVADYQIARTGLLYDYPDVTGFFVTVQCGSDSNKNHSCNAEADRLIEQGKAEPDPVKRRRLMTQALRLEMDDYPMIPLLQYSVPRLVKPWIGGYDDANDQDAYRSKDLYIVDH